MTTDVTTNQIIVITDEARANIISVRATEPNADELALFLDVAGVVQGSYIYDMYFEPIADATDDHEIFNDGKLAVVIPKSSASKLQGATLGISPDNDGGMEITNPNKPSTPPVTAPLDLSNASMEGDTASLIKAVLEQQINPAIASHGGSAELVGVDGDTAYIRMSGGCQGCAMSTATLRQGIEVSIREAVPSIVNVIDATDHLAGETPYYH